MTFQQKVQALVDARHTLGWRNQALARTKLAVALGVSEPTIRNWLDAKTEPRSTVVLRAVDALYDTEVGSNGK